MNPTPRSISRLLLLPALVLGLAGLACARIPLNAADDAADVEHGKYLAEGVGMCQDCHTPRDAQGAFDRSRWLQGSPLGMTPSVPMPWAPAAPMIAGLPTLTDAEAVTFFTTGALPGGRRLRPPMPEYRFQERDARALVAYLRGLAPTMTASR